MYLKLATVLMCLVPAVAPAAPPPQLELKWEAERLTLDAEGVPLSQVLAALSAKTGIEITGAGALDDRVSAHFAGMELIRALQELLSGLDYAIAAGPRVSRVLIVHSARNSGWTPPPVRTEAAEPAKPDASSAAIQPAVTEVAELPLPDVVPQDAKLAAIGTAANDRDRAALTGYLRDGDAAVQASAFQELAVQSKDTAVESLLAEIKDPGQPSRLQALQLLVQSAGAGETITMGTLRDALKDPDPAFNAYAIQMLAGNGDPGAVDLLTDAFHGAGDATRLMIVEQLAGTTAGFPLLREAAADPDPAVSAAAAALLKSLPVGARP